MAETIVGAKSKLYIKEQIPGITESGDTLQHVTAQEIAGNRVGLDTVIHGVYKTHVPPKLIEAGSVKRLIKITAHGARKGDILKINNGSAVGEEVSILKVEDADTIIIATEINASIGDEVFIMRHVTPLYDENGNLNVNATPGPSQFVQDGVDVEVEEDTVTMANNKPMPGGMYIKKDDGSWYPVTLDTTNPYAHTPIPVAITDVTGTSNVNVDLSGSSLSVNIKHDGASPSSIRIGDGTTLTSVTVNNELKVKDTDALNQLNDIETKQDTQITHLSEIEGAVETLEATVATEGGAQPAVGIIVGGHNGSGFFRHLRVDNAGRLSVDINSVPNTLATEATLSTLNGKIPSNLSVTASRLLVDNSGVTQPISAASLPLPTGAATEAKQDTMISSLASIASEDFATETTLAAMSAKLPAALGQGTMAQSMRVVLPSDQVVPTRENALSAGTVTDTTISGATVTTIISPVGARGMKIQAGINNTADLLVGLGGVTPDNTTNIGLEFQGGRSEDIVGASNVEVTSADPLATNQKIVIVWSYV